jgi:glucosamine--fructose-6-phosphate aminotransferase (isomerizing)
MCGIIGYIGRQDALPVLMNGLSRMEYRGYDSAGVAILDHGHTTVVKRPGKIANLQTVVNAATPAGHLGIGHTRWATHGEPNERNAHPHVGGHISIVHNGIIENYAELKRELAEQHGRHFTTDTDTEVLAHLIAVERGGNDGGEPSKSFKDAVLAALLRVEGTFGLLVIDEREPDTLIAARRGSPLLVGVAKDAIYLASDATAILGHTDRVVYLEDDEIVIAHPGEYKIIDFEAQYQQHEEQEIKLELKAIEKAGYEHFLLKEIMEQPVSVANTLRGRLNPAEGTSHLGGLNVLPDMLRRKRALITVACGTAGYAGLLGKYLLERMTGLPVSVETASEFRYRDAVLPDDALGLLISQSGETADTLASLRELKRRGVRTLGIVNAVGSSIAREVDGGIYLHVGPEISVASTKAFTSQVIAQILLGLHLGRLRNLPLTEGQDIIKALEALPGQIEQVLLQAPYVHELAKKLAHHDNVMFLGRDLLYPVALEGALKLKEVSYIHAEAYPAGEMKHGPNALIDPNLLVFFHAPQNPLYPKTRSNLEEVRARHGRLLLVGTEGDDALREFSDDIIRIPEAHPFTQPLLANIPQQLFAYYMAVERGTDVDQPRNLAKSVTVE